MISDRYLFTPKAKTVITRGKPSLRTGEVALHFSYQCPNCQNSSHVADLLEETGYYERTTVLKCACGTIYQYSN